MKTLNELELELKDDTQQINSSDTGEKIAHKIITENQDDLLNYIESKIKTALKEHTEIGDALSIRIEDTVIDGFIYDEIKSLAGLLVAKDRLLQSAIYKIVYNNLEKELLDAGYLIKNGLIILREESFKHQLKEIILFNLMISFIILWPLLMICIGGHNSPFSKILQSFVNIHFVKWSAIILDLITMLVNSTAFTNGRYSESNDNSIESNSKEFIQLGLCTLFLAAAAIKIYLSL